VHGDGILPRLEVRVQTPLFNPEKAGDYQPIIERSGTPILRINPNAISPEFATLHELGHLMDNVGLHTPTERRLYASEGQPELKDVMQAIRRSTAAGRLAARFTHPLHGGEQHADEHADDPDDHEQFHETEPAATHHRTCSPCRFPGGNDTDLHHDLDEPDATRHRRVVHAPLTPAFVCICIRGRC
jgi:hypothetical protein